MTSPWMPAIFEFPGIWIRPAETSSLESSVLKMVRRIRPDWPKEDIILQRFIQNSFICPFIVYGGYTYNKSDMILVKVYEHCYSESVDTKKLRDEGLTMRLLARNFLGPRMFATFSNGFVFDSISGIPLHYKLAIDSNAYPLIAYKIGEMHRKLSQDIVHFRRDDVDFEPVLFHNLKIALDGVKEVLCHSMCGQSKVSLMSELGQLEDRLVISLVSPESKPSVVFCHGNMILSNVVYDAVHRSVLFLNPEFAGPNYQSFEIAQHFLTLCGTDLDKVGQQDYVPAKEFQLRWCAHYLSGYQDIPEPQVSNRRVRALYEEVQRFGLVFCLQEVIWAMSIISNADIPNSPVMEDIAQYGRQRLHQYYRSKSNVFSFTI